MTTTLGDDGGATERRGRLVALAQGSGPDRLLRAALWVMAGIVVAVSTRDLLAGYPLGVDIEIPLRAASRWLDGGQPYLASSFSAPVGPDLPFLYPPFVLPFFAALSLLPRALVVVGWLGLGLGAAIWTCRRLAIPARWVPVVLLWPPFLEALLGGNVQLLLFACFVGLLYASSRATTPFQPVERDPAAAGRSAWADGFLGIANGALKPSQAQPWVWLARRRPAAALAGLVLLGAVVAITLPITGIAVWSDWLAQLGRASDPGWAYGGAGIAHGLPAIVGLGLTALTMVGAAFVPRRFAAAWLGLLMIVGNPSLRMFGLLTLLPGMLVVRREVALVAAICVASYTLPGLWLGVALVALFLAVGAVRPILLEAPEPAVDLAPGTAAGAARPAG